MTIPIIVAVAAAVLLGLCARALNRMSHATPWRTYFAHMAIAAAAGGALLSGLQELCPAAYWVSWLSLDSASALLVLVMTAAVLLDPRHRRDKWPRHDEGGLMR